MGVTDSPEPAGLLRLGRVGMPHGLDGTLKFFLLADPKHVRRLKRLWFENLGWRWVTRFDGRAIPALLVLKGISTRDQAESMRNLDAYCEREVLRLEEDRFLYADLIGLKIQSPNGEHLGVVENILENGPQDLLSVLVGEKTFLVPFQADYVQVKRNLDGTIKIEIDPIPGLLE